MGQGKGRPYRDPMQNGSPRHRGVPAPHFALPQQPPRRLECLSAPATRTAGSVRPSRLSQVCSASPGRRSASGTRAGSWRSLGAPPRPTLPIGVSAVKSIDSSAVGSLLFAQKFSGGLTRPRRRGRGSGVAEARIDHQPEGVQASPCSARGGGQSRGVCDKGHAESCPCDSARGPGVCRLRALHLLGAVSGNDLQ